MGNSGELGTEGNILNLIKNINKEHTTNILLLMRNLKLPLKSKIRYRSPLSPPLFNTILEVLANAVRRKETNTAEIGKEEKSKYPSWIAQVKSTHPFQVESQASSQVRVPPSTGQVG